MRTCLYLDDIRTPTVNLPNAHPWAVVRNYDEFVAYIETHGIPDLISLDHDLASEHMDDHFAQLAKFGSQFPDYQAYTEKTGLDCAKWLCEYCQKNNVSLKSVSVHSHNPVGSTNIQSYINGFKRFMGEPEDCFLMRHPFKTEEDES